MDRRRDRWFTGIGTGAAVFLVGGALAPGEAWWGISLVLASLAIAFGIARGV